MRKQYFWALQEIEVDKSLIHRFRTQGERELFVLQDLTTFCAIGGDDPEVRRIKRRLAAGEQITFPVEI